MSDCSSTQCCGLVTIFAILLFSANRKSLQNFTTFLRPFVFNINNRGPKDDLWFWPVIYWP